MAIQDVIPRASLVAAGGTDFPFTFPVITAIASTQIQVKKNGVLQSSGYTVTANAASLDNPGISIGGTVAFTIAPTSGDVIDIIRNTNKALTSVYQKNEGFDSLRVQSDNTLLAMMIQELAAKQTPYIETIDVPASSQSIDIEHNLNTVNAKLVSAVTNWGSQVIPLPAGMAGSNTDANILTIYFPTQAPALTGLTVNVQIVPDDNVINALYTGVNDPGITALTNRTGVGLVIGDVVGFDTANDSSVVLADTDSTKEQLAVSLDNINSLASGRFLQHGFALVNVNGAVVRGHYLVKAANTKRAKDSGTAVGAATPMPQGTFAVALAANASGDGQVAVLLLGGVFSAALPTLSGKPGVVNLRTINNASTPTAKIDIAAELVALRNPSDGSVLGMVPAGVLTCDTAVAGPAINGRDQAGGFSSDSWIHFYAICKADGSGLASICSTSASAPTLPATYTHWVYVDARRIDGVGSILPGKTRGNIAYFNTRQNLLTGGAALGETPISVASLRPPNALGGIYGINGRIQVGVAGSRRNAVLLVKHTAGATWVILKLEQTVNNGSTANGTVVQMPDTSDSIYYEWDIDADVTNMEADIDMIGYVLPNGAS